MDIEHWCRWDWRVLEGALFPLPSLLWCRDLNPLTPLPSFCSCWYLVSQNNLCCICLCSSCVTLLRNKHCPSWCRTRPAVAAVALKTRVTAPSSGKTLDELVAIFIKLRNLTWYRRYDFFSNIDGRCDVNNISRRRVTDLIVKLNHRISGTVHRRRSVTVTLLQFVKTDASFVGIFL